MKKRLIKTVVFAFIFAIFSCTILADYAFAKEDKGDPVKKLGRGISNTMLGFLEFPITIEKVGKESGVGPAISYGILKGIVRAAMRTIVGAYEIVSFWVPVPTDYKPIITDPEYIYQKEGL
jgi:putative exosortase-associated protein (TIGR04073 family)